MTKNLNLDQLRQVAGNATPGNWMWVNDREDERIRAGEFPYTHITSTDDVEGVNAVHIATFDPPTVLALIDRVELLEQRATTAVHVERKQRSRAEAAEQDVYGLREGYEILNDALVKQGERLEQAEAAVQRVREVAASSNKLHSEWILEALDGGEQK